MLGYWLRSSGDCPVGYLRLLDTPEVAACISRISAIISSVPIYLMENTRKGDVRVHDGLSRLVDIDPWPGMATRSGWMDWIVSTMLGEGDGNAFVLPQIEGGRFSALVPMPGASAIPGNTPDDYRVSWRGVLYHPTEVLHFRLFSDPVTPWQGRGYRFSLQTVVDSLQNSAAVRRSLTSPDYAPPLITASSGRRAYTLPR